LGFFFSLKKFYINTMKRKNYSQKYFSNNIKRGDKTWVN